MLTNFYVLPKDTIEMLAAKYDRSDLVQHALAELLHRRVREQQLLNKAAESLAEARVARGVLTLRWKRVGEHDLPIPSRVHDDDAGFDLSVVIPGGGTSDGRREVLQMFGTGWAVAIPVGWFGLIVPRSSVGKAGWDIESSGVIDAGYRGEVMLPLIYRGELFNAKRVLRHGDRVAQMLLLPVPRVESEEVLELPPTARGAGGFGSTGSGTR